MQNIILRLIFVGRILQMHDLDSTRISLELQITTHAIINHRTHHHSTKIKEPFLTVSSNPSLGLEIKIDLQINLYLAESQSLFQRIQMTACASLVLRSYL